MKIALPSNGRKVEDHFGHCAYFSVITIDENKKIISEELFQPPSGCGCKSNVIPALAEMGVKVLLAGNMGMGAIQLLNAHGIEVVRGCSGVTKTVTEEWLAGTLSDSGEGCTSHDTCQNH